MVALCQEPFSTRGGPAGQPPVPHPSSWGKGLQLYSVYNDLMLISLTIFHSQFKILWLIDFDVNAFLTIRSLQISAHATTAMLLWHVQNFVVINLLDFEWEQNEMSITFWIRLKHSLVARLLELFLESLFIIHTLYNWFMYNISNTYNLLHLTQGIIMNIMPLVSPMAAVEAVIMTISCVGSENKFAMMTILIIQCEAFLLGIRKCPCSDISSWHSVS